MFCPFRLLLDDVRCHRKTKIISRQVLAFSGMLRAPEHNEIFENNLSGKCIWSIKLTHDMKIEKRKMKWEGIWTSTCCIHYVSAVAANSQSDGSFIVLLLNESKIVLYSLRSPKITIETALINMYGNRLLLSPRIFLLCLRVCVCVCACVNAMLSNIFVVHTPNVYLPHIVRSREIDFVFALNLLFIFCSLYFAQWKEMYTIELVFTSTRSKDARARAEHTKRIGHGFQCMHCATAHTEDSESERVIIMRVFTYSSFFRTGFFSSRDAAVECAPEYSVTHFIRAGLCSRCIHTQNILTLFVFVRPRMQGKMLIENATFSTFDSHLTLATDTFRIKNLWNHNALGPTIEMITTFDHFSSTARAPIMICIWKSILKN